MDLRYSDGIAAARTMLAVEGNAAALQRRLPNGWELASYAGDDLRGRALWGANLLVPFHEVYAVRTQEGQAPAGLQQLSYIAFVSRPAMRAPVSSGTSTGSLTPRTPPPSPAGTATAHSPTSPGHKPSANSVAARPTYARPSPPSPAMGSCSYRWPTSRAPC